MSHAQVETKRISFFAVLLFGLRGSFALWLLGFCITLPYAPDFKALTPLSWILLLSGLVGLIRNIIGRRDLSTFKSRGRTLLLGICGLLFFIPAPVHATQQKEEATQPQTLSFKEMASRNTQLIGNPHAWLAMGDIYPSQGIGGFTPIFFQSLVPHQPIQIIATPNNLLHRYDSNFAFSGQQVIPLTPESHVWHTVEANSLPVHGILLVNEFSPSTKVDQDVLLQAVAVNCSTCAGYTHINIGEEYLVDLSLDFASVALARVPWRVGVLKADTALALGRVGVDLIEGDIASSGNRSVNLAAGSIAGELLPQNELAQKLADWGADQIAGSTVPVTTTQFKFQILRNGVGLTNMAGSQFAWQFSKVDTIYTDHIQTSTHSQVVQTYNTPENAGQLVFPAEFENNYRILEQSNQQLPLSVVSDPLAHHEINEALGFTFEFNATAFKPLPTLEKPFIPDFKQLPSFPEGATFTHPIEIPSYESNLDFPTVPQIDTGSYQPLPEIPTFNNFDTSQFSPP